MKTPRLFTPLKIGGLTLENRIIISPMCQYSAEDGCMTDWHTVHLGHLALSGAGMFIIEASAVSPEGRITPWDVGLYSDACEEAMATVLRTVRRHSAMPLCIQLAHAGRKASTGKPWVDRSPVPPEDGGWQTVAPSAIPWDEGHPTPTALSIDEIQRIKHDFVSAAERAARLGFEAIELHSAHGYLLHEFLSPLTNQRTDRYGGSFEGRTRLLLEVFEAVRAAFPAERPVGVRISCSDWIDGGWDLAQSVQLARLLDGLGCSFLDCSGGGLAPQQALDVGPGYQVHFSRAIKAAVEMPTFAVGLITEPEQAESILFAEDADAIALARAFLYEPRWPWRAAAALGAQSTAPGQYLRSAPHRHKDSLKLR